MWIKKNYLWIILLGTLVGLNETLIGGLDIPYRSAVVSTLTLAFLSLGSYFFPKRGTALLIVIIAILFKINNAGIHACTPNMLLCGPAALLLLGIGYEISGWIFISNGSFRYSSYILTCVVTSMVVFSVFGLLQTYILQDWDSGRLVNYIFARGSITAIASSAFSVFELYLARHARGVGFERLDPYLRIGIPGVVILGLWLFGTFSS